MLSIARTRREVSAERTTRLTVSTLLILLLATGVARGAEETPAADPTAPAEPALQEESATDPDSTAPHGDEGEPTADPEPPAHDVGPISITATRAERDVLDVPGNVTVIEREEIDRSGTPTLPALLRRQAGLYVTNFTTNPAGTSVESRGFNNGGALGSGLLVLVDGRRANEADTGNTDWALIPLDRVERIEIVRGPASAVYGDNAVGGVINIVTKAGPGEPRIVTRGGGGRYGSGNGYVSIRGTEGPVSLSTWANGLTTDGYRDRSRYRAGEFGGDVDVEIGDRVLIGASGSYHVDEREFPGTLSEAEIKMFGRRAADPGAEKDESDVDRWFLQGLLEAELAENVQLKVVPYYRNRDDDVTLTFLCCGTTGIEFDKWSAGVDAQVQVDLPLLSLTNRLIFGTTYLRDETDRTIASLFGTTVSDNRRDVIGVFLQEEINLTDDLLLSGGIRFDHAWYRLDVASGGVADRTRPKFDLWSPKGALTWRVTEPVAVYASYARGFRLPNFDEDAPVFTFDPMNPTALPNMKRQKSDSYEVGAKLRTDRVRGNIALYWMNVFDEIVFDPTFGAFGANENFDKVRHRGIETSIAIDVLSWLELTGTYTLEDVTIRDHRNPAFEGERMPITPLHRGTLALWATLPYHFGVGWNTNIVGSRGLSNDFTNARQRLSTYATHDLHIEFAPPLGEHFDGALTFDLRNLTGERYADFGSVAFDFGAGSLVDFFNPAARRTWALGFRLTLRR